MVCDMAWVWPIAKIDDVVRPTYMYDLASVVHGSC